MLAAATPTERQIAEKRGVTSRTLDLAPDDAMNVRLVHRRKWPVDRDAPIEGDRRWDARNGVSARLLKELMGNRKRQGALTTRRVGAALHAGRSDGENGATGRR
jgi:hypothetical protein